MSRCLLPCYRAAALALLLSLGACKETHKVEGFPERYAGIGIELTVEEERIRVVRPLQGGPSEMAGIQAGDFLLAVNGRSTEGMSLGEVVTRLRGKPHSQLTLSLERQGQRMLVVLKRQRLAKSGDGYQVID